MLKYKKTAKIVWIVSAVIVITSMIAFTLIPLLR
ncbi:MAG: hypothetical protein UW55_C0046G0003 [Candidatus Giovannonibacteria bacterium GW2011_GWA2_44_26]|uniref:DUF4044 domain-containing protein n=1 Tax=Candidatus Giovannonibacteria bacterium GW2011_GWA2_44_26 TaxID=1618648 RepID=A0A0G1LLD8_9BACT|nr:MAG: hypothetical protein UW55_C0046G0003 [Candidatus Giovannonibacteria bacterium GW2011_GWA2_44_26]